MSRTNPVVREHGTVARYRWGVTGNEPGNGCRCFECSDAVYRYERARRHAREAGVPAFYDATEVREHLLWLRSVGVGRRRISQVTGIAVSTIKALRDGHRTRVRPETADKLMGVSLAMASPGTNIPGGPTFALVDELLAMGYTQTELCRRLGMRTRGLNLRRDTGLITAGRAERIRRLHRQLTACRDAQREWDAERQADYRRRDRSGEQINRRRRAS